MNIYTQPDRPWCPECRESKWSWEREDGQCEECGTALEEEWPAWAKAWDAVTSALAVAIVAVLFLGPPVYIIWSVVHGVAAGAPLYHVEMEFVVEREPAVSGILPGVIPVLMGWLILLMVAWCASGGCPRSM